MEAKTSGSQVLVTSSATVDTLVETNVLLFLQFEGILIN